MRIAVDVAQTCVERAGCAWYADALARALVAGFPADEFQLLHHFGEWINYSTATGTTIASANVTSPLRDATPERAVEIWASAAHEGLPGAPDIVLASSSHAPRIAKAKLVVVVHDLAFLTFPEFSTERNRQLCQRQLLQALQRAAGFVFVSAATHAEFEAVFPGWLAESQRAWAIIPEASRFPAKHAPDTSPPSMSAPWLCVGSLEPRKNHATILAAHARYWAESAQRRPLTIVGGAGWLSDDVRREIAGRESSGAVNYAGYVTDAELEARYRGAFALLQMSRHEGFGLPIVEAMSLGLPVICSSIAAHCEVAADAAIFAPASDASALAAAMLQLEQDGRRHSDLVTAGRKRSEYFQWAKTAAALRAFLEKVHRAPPVDRAP